MEFWWWYTDIDICNALQQERFDKDYVVSNIKVTRVFS